MRWRTGPARVTVPATSANLGPGFDSLGLALSLADEITAEVIPGDFRVSVTGPGAGEVPTGADHLVVATMLGTFDALGIDAPAGLALTCHNQIPHARGLGSSAAAIVAGILLARALVREPEPLVHEPRGAALDDLAVLRLAARLEGHPDNVAACLLGGLTIAWIEPAGARAVRLRPHPGIHPVVFIPPNRGLTSQARAALPATVAHVDAAFTVARAALLVHAWTADPGLLLEATADRLHQDYRAVGMPGSAALLGQLRAAGIPAYVSGAGPSVVALTTAGSPAKALPEPPDGWTTRPLAVAAGGARIVVGRHAEGDPVAAGPPS